MSTVVFSLFQLLVVLLFAPMAIGLVRWFKARMQGRHGAAPWLPYWTLLTLMRKEMVISTSTSWVFRLVPFVVLGTALILAVMVPSIVAVSLAPGFDHFIVFSGVLALSAVFLVLGGLDSASAFGGMGSAREMTLAALVEPLTILSLGSFAIVSGQSSLSGFLTAGDGQMLQHPELFLALIALAIVTVVENARYPVDNPATHLELTMVHEAMVLEYSGPYLAMLEYATAIRLTVFAALLANFFAPASVLAATGSGAALGISVLWFLVKIVIAMFLLALLETSVPKMRYYRMQEFLTMGFLVAAAGFLFALVTL